MSIDGEAIFYNTPTYTLHAQRISPKLMCILEWMDNSIRAEPWLPFKLIGTVFGKGTFIVA